MSENIDSNNNEYYIYVDGFEPSLTAINVKPDVLVNEIHTNQFRITSFSNYIKRNWNRCASIFIVFIILSVVVLVFFLY